MNYSNPKEEIISSLIPSAKSSLKAKRSCVLDLESKSEAIKKILSLSVLNLTANRSKKIITTTATVLLASMLYGQGGVGINNTGVAPNSSAMLDVESSTKGMLIPRVALTGTTDATTITNGNVNSLLVFNTATVSDVTPGYYYWDATANVWKSLGADADSNPTNEIQSLSISGSTISLSNGGGSVTVPSSADNLGNHTATQNLDLSTYKLVGNGGSTGILIQNDGHTRIENLPQYSQATDTLLVIADNLGNLHQISLDSLASILVRDYGFTSTPNYPPGAVSCTGTPTAVVDVTNPATGKTWMDRNLGASQVATSSTDAASYGDLYQWGRFADGHQCRTSPTTTTNATTDTPGHGNFILESNSPNDWRTPQNNNLWQGLSGVNNPCPSGYRIPTEAELDVERLSWGSNNSAGAFGSPLRFPVAGYRLSSTGLLNSVGSAGYYWSSTLSTYARYLAFGSSNAGMNSSFRARGFSVRCIKG